jgi:hypothetical protein
MRRVAIAGEVALAIIGAFALHGLGGGWMILFVATVAGAATLWTAVRPLARREARRRDGLTTARLEDATRDR